MALQEAEHDQPELALEGDVEPAFVFVPYASSSLGARISVVIPTLNEAKNLPHVLTRLPRDLHEVILVDGHSTDGTVETARALCPDIKVVLQRGRGKGNALSCGFAACTGDIIVMLDADGSTDPAEIPLFLEELYKGADYVKGSRFLWGGGSDDITPARRLGNRMLNALVNVLYGTHYTDLCYGYNAFWARCLASIQIDCDGFEVETLMNVRVAKAGLEVREVPSFESNRIYGETKLNVWRDGLRVFRTIWAERFSQARRAILETAIDPFDSPGKIGISVQSDADHLAGPSWTVSTSVTAVPNPSPEIP